MPFQKNDPKTIEAAKRGGNTGKKHLQKVSKDELKKLAVKAGKASGVRRRENAKRVVKRTTEKIMNGYIET